MKRIFLDNIDSYLNIDKPDVAGNIEYSNTEAIHYFGRNAKAKLEETRQLYAKTFNVSANEIFYAHDSISQTKTIINYSILFLKIKQVVISVFENEKIIAYLKAHEKLGTIKLKFFKTDNYGKILLSDLKELLNKNTLLSLSHANEYTGILMPVKEISKICHDNNCLFHLNLSLTIGRYTTDFQKLNFDIASFDFKNLSEISNTGIIFLKQSINVKNRSYAKIKETLSSDESINIKTVIISSNEFHFSSSNIEKNKEYLINLKQYFISLMKTKLNLENLLASYNNEGLYYFVSYLFPTDFFGKHIAEKLDIEGIAVGKLKYPVADGAVGYELIRFGLSIQNTKKDIDYLIKSFVKLANNKRKK